MYRGRRYLIRRAVILRALTLVVLAATALVAFASRGHPAAHVSRLRRAAAVAERPPAHPATARTARRRKAPAHDVDDPVDAAAHRLPRARLVSGAGRPGRNDKPDPFADRDLRSFLVRRAADVTAAVYDIRTHTTYNFSYGIPEHTASIVKVDILATLLHQARVRGRPISHAERLLAEGMIEDSDNDDATDLWDLGGASRGVGAFDRLAGMTKTRPDRRGMWGLTRTTAADQILLLRHVLLSSRLLGAAGRHYVHHLMDNVVPYERWGISAGVPEGVPVAIKNGWLPVQPYDWQVNSIGEVEGPRTHYLIAVLTNLNSSEAYGISTIEHISRTVWRTLR